MEFYEGQQGIDWQQLYNQETPPSGAIFEEGQNRPWSPLTVDMMAKNVVSDYDKRIDRQEETLDYYGNIASTSMDWHGFQKPKFDADYLKRMWDNPEGQKLLLDKFESLNPIETTKLDPISGNPVTTTTESETFKGVKSFLENERHDPNRIFRKKAKEAVYSDAVPSKLEHEAVDPTYFDESWMGKGGKAQAEINEIYSKYGGGDIKSDYFGAAEDAGYFADKTYGQQDLTAMRGWSSEIKSTIPAEYYNRESALTDLGQFDKDYFNTLGKEHGWGFDELKTLADTGKAPEGGLLRTPESFEMLANTNQMPNIMQTAGTDAIYSQAIDPKLISAAEEAGGIPAMLKSAESYGASTAAELGAQALADPSLVTAGATAGVETSGLLSTMGQGFPWLMALMALGQAGSNKSTTIGRIFNKFS